MFRVESARITAAGVSFQLPTGFTLLESQEPHVNSTLALRAPDGSYQIIISLDHSAQSSGDELRSGKRGYWELRVDLPNADGKNGAPNTLVFQLVTHWGRGVAAYCDSPEVTALVQSLCIV